MAQIYWTGDKAPEEEVKNCLMAELVDLTDSAFTVRKESDDTSTHMSVYVEKKDPNTNNDFVWNKEQLPPKYMGWRILIIFVPIGYIKTIMDVPVREWY
jgi:hypothetical protein